MDIILLTLVCEVEFCKIPCEHLGGKKLAAFVLRMTTQALASFKERMHFLLPHYNHREAIEMLLFLSPCVFRRQYACRCDGTFIPNLTLS